MNYTSYNNFGGLRSQQPNMIEQISPTVCIDYSQELGTGNYASVHKGTKVTPTGKVSVAIKHLHRKIRSLWFIDNERYLRELQALTAIKHPNVMEFYEVIELKQQHKVFFVMEFCRGKTLGQLLCEQLLKEKTYGPLSQSEKLLSEIKLFEVLRQIVSAMAYVHLQGFMHRDLKPDNVILDEDKTLVKIIDFGVSRQVDNGRVGQGALSSYSLQGTPLYIAPNSLSGRPYSEKCDVWSVGVMMHELLTGTNYFQPAKKIQSQTLLKSMQEALRDNPIELPSHFSDYFRRTIPRMMAYDEDKRVTFWELKDELEMKWLEIGRSIDPNYRPDCKSPLKIHIKKRSQMSESPRPQFHRGNTMEMPRPPIRIVASRPCSFHEIPLGPSRRSSPQPRSQSPPLEIPVLSTLKSYGQMFTAVSRNQSQERLQAMKEELQLYSEYACNRAQILINLAKKLRQASASCRFGSNLHLSVALYLLECLYILRINQLIQDLQAPVLQLTAGKVLRRDSLDPAHQAQLRASLHQNIGRLQKEKQAIYHYIRSELYSRINIDKAWNTNPNLFNTHEVVFVSARELVEKDKLQDWNFYIGCYQNFLLSDFHPTYEQLMNAQAPAMRLFYECMRVCLLLTWLPDELYTKQDAVSNALQELQKTPIDEVITFVKGTLDML